MPPIKHGPAYRLWRRIEGARVDKGWTKSELAEHSGLRRATIDNLATSSRAPQPRIVRALAQALGIDLDEANQLAGLLPESAPGPEDPIIAEIRRSRTLNSKQQDMLIGVVEELNQLNRLTAGTTGEADEDGRPENSAG